MHLCSSFLLFCYYIDLLDSTLHTSHLKASLQAKLKENDLPSETDDA